VLIGRRSPVEVGSSVSANWNYSVHPIYASGPGSGRGVDVTTDTPWRRITSHAISNNIRVLSTQPSQPFAYSTSEWAANDLKCDVNVEAFRPVSRTSATGGGTSQRVAVEVTSSSGAGSNDVKLHGRGFEYRLKSTLTSPHVHFFIPGGETFS